MEEHENLQEQLRALNERMDVIQRLIDQMLPQGPQELHYHLEHEPQPQPELQLQQQDWARRNVPHFVVFGGATIDKYHGTNATFGLSC